MTWQSESHPLLLLSLPHTANPLSSRHFRLQCMPDTGEWRGSSWRHYPTAVLFCRHSVRCTYFLLQQFVPRRRRPKRFIESERGHLRQCGRGRRRPHSQPMSVRGEDGENTQRDSGQVVGGFLGALYRAATATSICRRRSNHQRHRPTFLGAKKEAAGASDSFRSGRKLPLDDSDSDGGGGKTGGERGKRGKPRRGEGRTADTIRNS